jgi:putative addiction module killer protein
MVYPKVNNSSYTVFTTEQFDTWFSNIKDKQAKHRIQVRIDRIEDGNFGDCKTLGSDVSELRIHYASGIRVYFTIRNKIIVILLAGGDKATQFDDIKQAQAMAKQV